MKYDSLKRTEGIPVSHHGGRWGLTFLDSLAHRAGQGCGVLQPSTEVFTRLALRSAVLVAGRCVTSRSNNAQRFKKMKLENISQKSPKDSPLSFISYWLDLGRSYTLL